MSGRAVIEAPQSRTNAAGAGDRVLLAVHDAIIGFGLSHGLSALAVDTMTAHGSDVLETARTRRPGLAVVDAGDNSVKLVAALLDVGVRSVVLTSELDLSVLGRCLEAGAVGVVSKAESLDVVCEKIRAALDHTPVHTDGERQDMLAAARRRRDEERRRLQPFLDLSVREQEILFLLTEGLSAQAAARRLYVSTSTVRMHIQRILRTLDVKTQVAAVAKANAAGWASTVKSA